MDQVIKVVIRIENGIAVINNIAWGSKLWSFRSDDEFCLILFQLDDTNLGKGGDDGVATMYDATLGQQLRAFRKASSVKTVAFSRDDTKIVIKRIDVSFMILKRRTRWSFLEGMGRLVVISQNDNRIVVGSVEGNLAIIYDVTLSDIYESFKNSKFMNPFYTSLEW